MVWPWTLTFWPQNLISSSLSRDAPVTKVWRKSVDRYWRYRGNIKLPRESRTDARTHRRTHGQRHGRTTRKHTASVKNLHRNLASCLLTGGRSSAGGSGVVCKLGLHLFLLLLLYSYMGYLISHTSITFPLPFPFEKERSGTICQTFTVWDSSPTSLISSVYIAADERLATWCNGCLHHTFCLKHLEASIMIS